MADILHVKTKSKWKDVDLSTIFASKGDFDGLISFQELTDYEILNDANKKRGKVKYFLIVMSFRDTQNQTSQ